MTAVEVCCGVGGTGKTTTSAALGVGYAMAGDHVVVLTIDPARRLADALGIGTLDNLPREVPLPRGAKGTLHALMLDRKSTWDGAVRRHASQETAERLMENAYYRAVSTRLSGSHEYMAIEKLHELVSTGAWDRVIVDTPPAQHVLDFFQAPERVRGLLDRSMLRVFLEPGTGLRGAATRKAFGLVEHLAGERAMSDIREFFSLMGELSGGFRQRSAEIAELLRGEETRYWLISHADAPERNDLLGFLEELRSNHMNFAGFLVNRVQPPARGPFPTKEDLLAVRTGANWEEAVERLLTIPDLATERASRHRAAARDLAKAAGGAPVWLIPDIPGGIQNVEGLNRLVPFMPPNPPTTLR